VNVEVTQNEFGYFGKLPTFGDFVHQLLPQDFANGWHEWLQHCMADARESFGDDFLTWYLNCPAWKFLMTENVCGEQAVVGLTIPSVDRVGRYFNFTLATVLPPGTNPCTYVMRNRQGLKALEILALDILEQDYPKDEIVVSLRELSLEFSMVSSSLNEFESQGSHIRIKQNQPLPFSGQASVLLSHLVNQQLGPFSMWWSGEEGQTQSKLLSCSGMPTGGMYLELLTQGEPPVPQEKELNPIDKIIAGDDGL